MNDPPTYGKTLLAFVNNQVSFDTLAEFHSEQAQPERQKKLEKTGY